MIQEFSMPTTPVEPATQRAEVPAWLCESGVRPGTSSLSHGYVLLSRRPIHYWGCWPPGLRLPASPHSSLLPRWYPNGKQSPLTCVKCSVGWGFLMKDGNCHTSFHRNKHLGAFSPADLEKFSRGVLLYSRGEAALLDGTESESLIFQIQIRSFPKGVAVYPGI